MGRPRGSTRWQPPRDEAGRLVITTTTARRPRLPAPQRLEALRAAIDAAAPAVAPIEEHP